MPTVLIVEDEENIRELVTLNLTKRGYQTLGAGTVPDGFDVLQRTHPQLLIVDIRMPDASGWELLRRIDDDPHLAKLPVVIMTASTLKMDDEYSYPNVVGRLVKPFEITELLQIAETGLRGFGSMFA